MKLKAFLILLLCSLSTSAVAQIEVGDKGKLSGLVFGDYYWIPYNHNSELEGNNGFQIRRVYFTYDRKISDSFSTRLRLEMNSKGDFNTDAKLTPYVKDAYLKWEKNYHQILAGISGTPTYSVVRATWGYRSVEKTPLNLQKMGNVRDFGLSFKGKLGSKRNLDYHFMFGNGEGKNTELNQGKKFMLSLVYKLTNRLAIQAYGDWNDRANGKDIYTTQGFLAYQTKALNIGALYAHQIQKEVVSAQDLDLNIASVFTNFRLIDTVRGLFRIDHLFEANPVGENIDYIPFSNQAESTLLIAGADVSLDSKVHLIPNIETVFYGKTPEGTTPATDAIPRLTLYYAF